MQNETEAFIEIVRSRFTQHFGRTPDGGARAPGRVNLIGEHTDYTHGLVLPCAIDRDTVCFGAARDDGRVRVWAADLGKAGEGGEIGEFEASSPAAGRGWLDYVQAVFASLAAESGDALPGLDLVVSSRVPLESGLSSSAALGLSTIGVLNAAGRLDLKMETQARIVHRGERDFVGVGCGLLDQFASALGRRDHALRIDCRTGAAEAIALPPGRLEIVLIHSEVERALASGIYRQRVDECAAALEAARAAFIGGGARPLAALRDLTRADLPALERALDEIPFRRARHVITENDRVDCFVDALRRGAGALDELGPIMAAGQASLRDDYEVSLPELDALCAWGDAHPDVFGARLTGAGFGGCALNLVRAGAAEAVKADLVARFEARFGKTPRSFVVRAGPGASPID